MALAESVDHYCKQMSPSTRLEKYGHKIRYFLQTLQQDNLIAMDFFFSSFLLRNRKQIALKRLSVGDICLIKF
jgi:hypothetical protein